jgi:LysM repeat protein
VRPATVVVAEGQTLADLARRWGTTVHALMMTNDLVSERVRPGQVLKLPPATRR